MALTTVVKGVNRVGDLIHVELAFSDGSFDALTFPLDIDLESVRTAIRADLSVRQGQDAKVARVAALIGREFS
jgi:hypothetical protein